MANISKITLPAGDVYDVKDAVARSAIEQIAPGLTATVVQELPTASASSMLAA